VVNLNPAYRFDSDHVSFRKTTRSGLVPLGESCLERLTAQRRVSFDPSRFKTPEANPRSLRPIRREQLLLTQAARNRETAKSLAPNRGVAGPSMCMGRDVRDAGRETTLSSRASQTSTNPGHKPASLSVSDCWACNCCDCSRMMRWQAAGSSGRSGDAVSIRGGCRCVSLRVADHYPDRRRSR
jgi:hypothetical protein